MKIPSHWRLKSQRYQLEGSICSSCGQSTFPPRPICPYCHAQPKMIAVWEFQVFSEMKQLGAKKLEIDHGG